MNYDFNGAFAGIDHDLTANHSQLVELIQALRTEVWFLHEELRELRLSFGFPESATSAHHNLGQIAREALGE